MQQEEVILGARALGDQVVKIMPTYQIMLNQLEDIREAVKQVKDYKRDRDTRKQVYNNTIGIFGPRGAGKSSALFTLKNDMDKKSSVLFPLIEPDNFGENTKIIGSIVGFLKKEGEDLLEELKKGGLKEEQRQNLVDYYNAGVYKPNNKLQQVINETIEYHLYTENQYRNILTQHYEDLAVYIKNSSRVLSPDIAFKKKLNELIDEIIRVKQALDTPEEPILIFIFIDDIDLKTSKTRELMEALLQYTDHPNIVTVLSGDYEMLLESLTLALFAEEPLKEIGLNAYDSLKALDQPYNRTSEEKNKLLTIMRRKSELAHEYLKKVIPSARRHQLVNWNTETIPYFSFGQFNLLDRMAQLMGEQSIFSYVKSNQNTNNENEQDRYLPIKNSYVVFDERPRGLVHAYYNLVQLINEIEVSKKELFRPVKVFVDTLILSNTNLLKHQEWLFEHFIRWGSDEKSTFINYSAKNLAEDGLDLQIFIVAEIIKKLLPNVRYDAAAFETFKASLFEEFIRGKNEKEYKFHPSRYRLYHVIHGIVLYTDVPAAMLMLEYLSMSSFDSYYYEYTWDIGKREKDRIVVKSVAYLLGQYPSIFEPLYYKAQNEKNSEINKALNILHDLCAVPAEFEITERVFEELLRNFRFEKSYNGLRNEEIKRTLFINNLTKIREKQQEELTERNRSDLVGNITVLAKDEHLNLAKGLLFISEKLSKNPSFELPKSVTQIIERDMDKFGEFIFDKLKERSIEVHIEITELISQAFYEFRNGYPGESNTTKYRKCKDVLHKYLNLDPANKSISLVFDEYREIMRSLKGLASNNLAWYGRREARNLYNALQYSSTIADRDLNNTEEDRDSFFTGNDTLILSLYYQYYASTQKFSEEQEYESAKTSIKTKLDEAFKNIQGQTEMELREFGLSLEGAEE
ncbi:AAA ATPase domain-containing protein [Paenibacillus uliginis N3/975]|uniref:AAA ATPase domain-containing protein n=1 Tax=Paenibacillus uliginis N3/975 TaxID=1313296 RepID=A0A1X7HRW1_9BACL|nr:AAA family ATPase [Paenibacillus uliginis]SMF90968.1 AAA ATPase domain-containing protein [Paenibacillus uliginis N3/975]